MSVQAATSHLVEVDGVTHRVVQDEAGVVRAPAPAVVVAVRAAVGQEVEAGQTIAVLESMKMETPVRAPYAGRVRELLAAVNAQVDAGAPLLRLDRAGDEAAAATGERVVLPDDGRRAGRVAARRPPWRCSARCRRCSPATTSARGACPSWSPATAPRAAELPVDDPELLQAELGVLTTFADLCELSRNRPTTDEEDGDAQVHSPREFFHAYLHSLDFEREALPEGFRARLARALLHYGVRSLEPGPELEDAVHRVFLAQQRTTNQLPAVLALLDRWLTAGQLPTGPSRGEVAEVLDRLIVATQLRYPSVGDLARAVRFRYFEQPVVLEARATVFAEAERLLAELTDASGGADSERSAERIEALVASPEPLIRLLAQRFESSGTAPEPILEVLTRRYYRRRSLEHLHSTRVDGRPCVTGDYELNGVRLHLVSLMSTVAELPQALDSLTRLLADVADPANVVVDLYLSWPDRPADTDAVVARLRELLTSAPALQRGRRVTATVCTPDGEVEPITFRPSDEGLAEERVIRGLHPLTAQRLNLWRLKNFDGVRLPSAEDTYLLHVVAKDNPNDERFIAMAEVRDVTPLRDDAGEVVAFPTVERQLAACLDGIRTAQAQRGSGRRLEHNRIFLYAWPSIELPRRTRWPCSPGRSRR